MRNLKKGVTLIELIVVLSLIGIVIQLGYSMLIYGNNTFNMSTSRGLSQQNVRLAETVLSDELKHISSISSLEDDFVTKYYSLKYTAGELIKSYHVLNDVTDLVEVTVVKRVAGDWDTLKLSNVNPGELDILIGQAEMVGNKSSRFELPFKIFTINNHALASGIDVDLVTSGHIIYYQQMYDHLSLMSNAMSVDIADLSPGGSGDSFKDVTITFNDNGLLTPAAVIKKAGEQYTLPIKSKTGFIFNGWNTAENLSGILYGGIINVPNDDVTFYADWTETSMLSSVNNVSLTYKSNNNKDETVTSSPSSVHNVSKSSNSMKLTINGANLSDPHLKVLISGIDSYSKSEDGTSIIYIDFTKDITNDFSLEVSISRPTLATKNYIFRFKAIGN